MDALGKKNDLKITASILLILVFAFVSFSPSLKNDFTNWDDGMYLTDNTAVRSLSLNNIKKIFTSFIYGNYHPLTIFSYTVEYHFFQYRPFVYHLTSLILHALNCLLVFWLIKTIARKTPVALITALFFAIHPLRVESVAWISERKDVLYSFFFLGALIGYTRYLQKKSDSRYYIAILLFILSLLSKTMAVTFPFILFLIDYVSYRKFDKIMIWDKIPFFVLSIIFGTIAVFGQYAIGALPSERQWDVLYKLKLACSAISFYLGKIFLPVNLSCLYPSFSIENISPCPLFTLIVLITAAAYSIKYTRKIIFGSVFFLLAIAPAALFIQKTVALVGDRYTYIPSIGIFYIIGVIVSWIQERKSGLRSLRLVFLATLTAIFLLLSFLSWNRCKVWRNSIVLWRDAIGKAPLNPIAYYSLGCEYQRIGKNKEAVDSYLRAIKINPGYAAVYNNLAVIYVDSGDVDKAIGILNRAIQANPHFILAHSVLSRLYFGQKQYDLAIEHCDRVYACGGEVDRVFLEQLRPFRR